MSSDSIIPQGEQPCQGVKCKKCKKILPEGAAFCPWCGRKVTPQTGRKPKTRGNGTGTVFKRGDTGTWAAQKVIGWKYGTHGNMIPVKRTKGGFATKREAMEALATISTERRTAPETWEAVYNSWLPTHRASAATMDCYKAANKHFKAVWLIRMNDMSIDDLQECIDTCPKGRRTQENMRSLAGLLYKYAVPRGLAPRNLAEYLVIRDHTHGDKAPLPDSALDALKAHVDDVPGADIVLCHCYLGFRPSELLSLTVDSYNREERAFVGGAKTEAGKNRTVTVPPVIQPFIDRRLRDKIAGPVFGTADGQPMSIGVYRALFYRVLAACGIENPSRTDTDGKSRKLYTPHSCRHTFAMLTARASSNDYAAKKLTGHSDARMLDHYRNGADLDLLREVTDRMA